MDSKLEVSLDKLPVKRLDAIEENGAEHFPPDVDYDERRLSLIRRIDFAWAVQKEDKKQKKSSKESTTPWPWQSMVENLQLAHQELSVIIDLINTVEANDAVTVAGMTRPKQLPNELLSDLAVSAATKLQCFRHLGKYFKKSAKSLEQQVAREARFYGALIRLQQNWKVKRQRIGASAPGNDGFTVDLFDSSFSDPAVISRPSLSTVRVDHDSAGMLAINLPPNSCRSLHFGFLKTHLGNNSSEPNKVKAEQFSRDTVSESSNDDDSVKETHSVLREVHQTIFDEQVFDLVNHEAFNPSVGVNMTDIRENYLELNLGQRTSVFISLGPSSKVDETDVNLSTQNVETSSSPMDSFDGTKLAAEKQDALRKMWAFPSRISCEIYLRQIFHEYMLVRAKDRPPTSTGARVSGQPAKDGSGLLGHFCLSLAHRIFSNKVLMELEKVVCRVPYLHLISQPTWNSRTSSWTLFMKVPESVRDASSQTRISDIYHMKTIKSQFRTKVVVNDDCINVEGEGAPNAVSLLKGSSEDICPMNRYDCDLADLSMIILQQVASQVIRWLHEEAVMVGIKANRDFLCLTLELEQGETLSLVAHVDPEDSQGCISWWLVMEDDFSYERKLSTDISDTESEYRKFLGHLSLDILYSTLMDLVSLCSGGSNITKSTSTTV